MSLKTLFDEAVAKLESLHPHLPPAVADDVQQTVTDLKTNAESAVDTGVDGAASFAASNGITIAPSLVSTLKELVSKELDTLEEQFATKKTNLTSLKSTLTAGTAA